MKTIIPDSVRSIYAQLRRDPVSMEAEDLVRISSEPEVENYFDVFGREENERDQQRMQDTIDRLGCRYVFTEYRDANRAWQRADSIGMCVYDDPESPFENCYVAELMCAAIKGAEAALTEQADETAERLHWEARDTITR